jgi:hypothetical protein
MINFQVYIQVDIPVAGCLLLGACTVHTDLCAVKSLETRHALAYQATKIGWLPNNARICLHKVFMFCLLEQDVLHGFQGLTRP